MLLILAVGTTCTVLATLLPFCRNTHWLIRGFDFPRLQIAIVAVALLTTQLFILDLQAAFSWLLVATTTMCLAVQLWWIVPYTVIWPKEVKSANPTDTKLTLSILTSNVLMHNRNTHSLIELVNQYQPDILVTLESNSWWEEKLSDIETFMPYTVKCPLENLYGMHVYSRLALEDEKIAFLVESDVPSIHLSLQLRSGDKVQMHFVHPAPPSPTENTYSSERDAELVILAKSVSETNKPIIITGDLNDVAWSTTTRLFRKISGLLDPRIGRGMFNTFHAKYFFMRWPLDHLFHSKHFTLNDIKRLNLIGSDHFALFTSLVYSPTEQGGQDGITADSKDVELAQEIMAEKNVSPKDVPEP